ncbi:MAG: peroxide stress protein YaaA [Microbacteriaceae bacterium]
MLILLPPSETKRHGGRSGRALQLDSLRYPALLPLRVEAVAAVETLAGDPAATMAALKLSRRQADEVTRNREISSSPTLPAIDRYSGVLYEALDAASLTSRQRSFAHRHVVIHSALLGPVAALDEIPAYRLSASSRLPGFALRRHWSAAVTAQLADATGVLLDLRSEGYVALGPLPTRRHTRYVHVVSEGPDGRRRALNHFNKHAKGEFARAMIQAGRSFRTIAELISWSGSAGFDLSESAPGELELCIAGRAESG